MVLDDGHSPEMSPEEFRLLSEMVYSASGLFFREESRYLLERRLRNRLKALNLADFAAYHRYLRFDPGRKVELETAIDVLTTNETYFFREPLQLKAFSEELLPILAKEKAKRRRIRMWSAGCSTGEEAYTMAILVKESGLFEGWDIEIFGSDISRRVLQVARKAVYAPAAMRQAPPELTARYFRQDAGKFIVKDDIRALVTFGQINLLDEAMLNIVPRMDVIFCRNVMIYFDLQARRRVLKSFYDKLVEGAYLLLGHSESLINVTADFELVHLKHDLLYRKPKLSP